MFHRATTFLVVLAIAVGATSALHAQSLSPDQEAKLDARLERIIQKANQGELDAAIDRYTRQLENARQNAKQKASRSDGRSDRKVSRSDFQRQKLEAPSFTSGNVKPSGRTEDGTPEYQAIVYTENPASLERSGVRVGSTFDGFATVRATPEGLRALSDLRTVRQVHSPKRVRRHNDEAAAQAGVRTLNNGIGGTKYTGEDVMTCVIDTGIDWDHPDFTDEQGRSRIRYIWDQIEDTRGVGSPEYGDFDPQYGDEYGPSDIQSGNVQEADTDGHGTHVTGTVASSGNAYEQTNGVEKFKGMAPEADIIAVKAGGGTAGFSNVGIIDGINYCNRVAEQEGKPVVVNMSLGTLFRPGDGTSPLAAATTALTDGGTESGMVVVASAGNSGSSAIHTGPSTAPANDSTDIGFTVGDTGGFGTFGYAAVLWAYEIQEYSLSVYTPDMEDTLTVSIPDSASVDSSITTANGAISIFSSPSPIGGNRSFEIIADDAAADSVQLAGGEWTFRLRNEGDADTDVHGWQFPPVGFGVEAPPGTQFTDADKMYTLGSPSTATGAISVGAYTHRTRWSRSDGVGIGFPPSVGAIRDSIATFSSRGPRVGDGPQKPEITASGEVMVSALSGSVPVGGFFGLNPNVVVDENHFGTQGTSMSAPTVAGSVALLLQEDPTLSTNRVRDLLAESARVDDAVERRGGAWNPTFGHGKLNALGALTRLRQGQGSPPMEVLAYHDEPFLFANSVADTIGTAEGAADSLALRFTPNTSGFVTGAYVSVAGNSGFQQTPDGNIVVGDSANTLTDSLHVQVHMDDDGTPGAPVGNPVAVPPSKLRSYHSNFVSFDGAGASVESGTDYHLVVTTGDDEDGSLRVLAESLGDTSGRSMKKEGSSWTATGNDLVMRTQVSADVFPPAAVAGLSTTSEEPENVGLDWSAVDGAGEYYVFRDTEPLPASTSGLTPYDTVEAGTTTYTDGGATAGQTYYYRVAAVNDDGNEGEASGEVNAFLYPQNVTADANRTFGDGPPGASGASYRLVALPGDVSQALDGTLDGQAGLDWQAYAETSSGLVPYDGSDTFTLEAGNGFWLSSASAWTSSAEASTVSLQGDSAATVSLSDGWTIVSNPTGKDVPFAAIQAAHPDTLQPPMGWDGSWYVADTMKSAASGEAYYFNNTAGLDELTIPYPGSPGDNGGGMAAPKAKDASLLALSARSATTGGPASTVKVGLDARASNGLDARDLRAPTGQFENVSLRLDAPESSRSLLVERRAPIGDGTSRGRTFTLKLDSEVSGPVQISARNLSAVEGYEVALLQPGAGQTHDLRHSEQVTVTPDGETTLKLAVGSQAYVEGRSETVVPDEVTLSSYPNPFRQQATVEYALPKAQEVRLVLYDVLGREVAVLDNGRKDAGHHTVRLNADQLASGVYFGRLKAGNKQLTQKITVVR
jgi:subtilisin family serine protease